MNTVQIKNRDTGEIKSGNWKGLRKALGISRNFKASSCIRVFDSMGWDVISGADTIRPPRTLSNVAATQVESIASGNGMIQTDGDKLVQNTPFGKIEFTPANNGNGSAVHDVDEPLETDDGGFIYPTADPNYIRRHYDSQLEKILDNLAATEYPFLFGDAATGKTSMVKEYCAKRNIPYTRIALDETMSIQYILGRLSIDNGSVVYREGLLVKAIQRAGVVFLDEANGITPSKNFLMNPLLDSGQVYIPEADRTFVKHPLCRIVLAGNFQNGKYTGVQKMNGAFQTRLCAIEVAPIDPDTVHLKFIKTDERRQLFAFYADTRAMLDKQKSKALITLRHIFRYDNLRAVGFDEREAVVIAFVNSVKYADDRLAEDTLMLAKSRFGF